MKSAPEYLLFESEYKRLNAEQRRAVDTLEGPVMVMAGPGTGKTQILSLRIANIVHKTDTPPNAILALTFTESAAHNMRKRLIKMMGSRAYEVHIHTFHGLASELIQKYPESFPRIIGSQLASDVDKLDIVEEILRKHTGKHIRWYDSTTTYVDGLLSSIDTLKREYISPAQLAHHIADEIKEFEATPDKINTSGRYKGAMKGEFKDKLTIIEKNTELVDLYAQFNEVMAERKLYDFTDMLTELVHACENDQDFLMSLQEEYQYILVDEHQDSNNVQNRLIELLGSFHENPNIFVVGDDKQSIYRFQGASPDYFYGFKKKYPDATLVHLVDNYRSSQEVLDVSHTLLPGEVQLQARSEHESIKTDLAVFTSEDVELFAISEQIKVLIQSGTLHEEIAILTRTNSDSTRIAQALSRAGVPHIVESDIDVIESSIIRMLLSVFRSILNPHDNKSLTEALYAPWSKLHPLDCARIIHYLSKKRTTSLIDILIDEKSLKQLSLSKTKPFVEFGELIMLWHTESYSTNLISMFTDVSAKLDVISSIKPEDLQTALAMMQVLYDDVQGFASSHRNATFREYGEYLKTLEDHGKKLKLKNAGGRPGYVRIMTAHKSKGLEFDHVFVPFMIDKKWGNRRNMNPIKILERAFDGIPSNESQADERRLLYVTLTRARKKIHISYSERKIDGGESAPSVFLADIQDNHIEVVDTSEFETNAEAHKLSIMMTGGEKSNSTMREEFHSYIVDLFEQRPISATHLNNFVTDPWQYIFKNLIRVPELQSSSLIYGTAIHGAIDALYKSIEHGNMLSVEEFVSAGIAILEKNPLSDSDLIRLTAQAERTLPEWYAQNAHSITGSRGYSELAIRGLVMGGTDIVLSGQIDRLEFVDGSDIHIRIIDFKTGKAKSRNDILGKTKSSDGNYYRQLQFYALLMRYFHDGQYIVDDFILHFVEPKSEDKYVIEHFQVPDEEVDELEELIIEMKRYIMSGAYWDHIPDPDKCTFVPLVEKLKSVE